MAAVALPVGQPRFRAATPDAAAIEWLTRLLLVAVALDLIVTRFVVRLAIFVPKGEPWATVSAVLGRFGAATDAFVPLVGLLLLGALLVRVGRTGRRLEAVTLVALAVVAAGGFALIHFPPVPAVMLVLESLVVAVAVGSAIRVRDAQGPVVARIGLLALAGAIALAAIGRAVDLAGATVGSSGHEPGGALAIIAVGQSAFVCGAALVGLGGVRDFTKRGRSRGRFPAVGAVGVATALFVIFTAAQAPATVGAIAIWSIGLSGAVPAPVIAVSLGLAVAGLPVLHRRAPALAVGASIVLLSGYGLAASGLVLAGLLGLVVAGSTLPSGPGPAGDWGHAS